MKLDKNNLPDKNGFFGEYGGKFVPETLMYALEELEATYEKLKNNNEFKEQFYKDLSEFVGRPSPLYFAERLTKTLWYRLNMAEERRSKPYWCA